MTKPVPRAHAIAQLVPDMTSDQYDALVNDVREHGLQTPIVVDIETIALAAKAVKAAPEIGPYLQDQRQSRD